MAQGILPQNLSFDFGQSIMSGLVDIVAKKYQTQEELKIMEARLEKDTKNWELRQEYINKQEKIRNLEKSAWDSANFLAQEYYKQTGEWKDPLSFLDISNNSVKIATTQFNEASEVVSRLIKANILNGLDKNTIDALTNKLGKNPLNSNVSITEIKEGLTGIAPQSILSQVYKKDEAPKNAPTEAQPTSPQLATVSFDSVKHSKNLQELISNNPKDFAGITDISAISKVIKNGVEIPKEQFNTLTITPADKISVEFTKPVQSQPTIATVATTTPPAARPTIQSRISEITTTINKNTSEINRLQKVLSDNADRAIDKKTGRIKPDFQYIQDKIDSLKKDNKRLQGEQNKLIIAAEKSAKETPKEKEADKLSGLQAQLNMARQQLSKDPENTKLKDTIMSLERDIAAITKKAPLTAETPQAVQPKLSAYLQNLNTTVLRDLSSKNQSDKNVILVKGFLNNPKKYDLSSNDKIDELISAFKELKRQELSKLFFKNRTDLTTYDTIIGELEKLVQQKPYSAFEVKS